MDKKFEGTVLKDTNQEILDLSMSFDEKVQIVESPMSEELVTRLVAQIASLEKEVRNLKVEMKAIRSSSSKQHRPGIKSLVKHQVYFDAPVDVPTALNRVRAGLKASVE